MAEEEKKEEQQEGQEISQEELAKQWEEALLAQQQGGGEVQETQEETKEESAQSEEEPKDQPAPVQSFSGEEKKTMSIDTAKILDRLMDIPLTVEVVVGETTIQIRDLINLGPGSVLELDRETTEPVDIKVNGKLMAKGELVVVGEKFGVRITEIYTEERKSIFRDTIQESLRKG